MAAFAGGRAYLDADRIEFLQAGAKVSIRWVGACPDGTCRKAWWRAEEVSGYKYYCNTPSKELCSTRIPVSRRLVRAELYPGVDWVMHGRGEDLEYDLVVQPRADVRRLRFRVEEAAARLDPSGELRAGAIRQWRPEAYQEAGGVRQPVAVALVPAGPNEFTFRLGPYRRDLPLVIDPVIQWAERIGGADEDVVAGTLSLGPGRMLRYGTTKSGDWNRQSPPNSDVFVRSETNTVYWGGSGDEFLGGADFERVNGQLTLAGWTNSRDAVTTAGSRYQGGASDGFVLLFRGLTLAASALVGGPGEDRLYAVQCSFSVNWIWPSDYYLAGETDNPEWAGATLQRIGEGGGRDAVFARLEDGQLNLTVIGGAGEDRATALRREFVAVGTAVNGLVLAGETESPNFPVSEGTTPARGRDAWTAIVDAQSRLVRGLRLWGGAGNETVRGVAWIPGAGFYLAGTTDSPDLPAAQRPYRGGPSDGFVAWLDEGRRLPVETYYLGGDGRDEINAMQDLQGDLLVGGATDSSDLGLPGLNAGEAAGGGLDALLVLCDTRATPLKSFRFGASGDDRILSVEPLSLGVAVVSGSTESAEWLRPFDPYALGGARDGFAVSVKFANLRVSLPDSRFSPPLSEVVVGQNLSLRLQVEYEFEPGMDRLFYVRSADPSKMLISRGGGTPAGPEFLAVDTQPGLAGVTFWIEALASEGEADVILEGRAAGSPFGTYPRRRLRVKFAPAGWFFEELSVRANVGTWASLRPFLAPVLPGNLPGPPQTPRSGVVPRAQVVVSDPTSLVPARQQFSYGESLSVLLLREGEYTVRLAEASPPAVTGQMVAVRSGDRPNLPSGALLLVKDHFVAYTVRGAPGDSLQAVAEDPSLIRVGTALDRLGGAVEFTLGPGGEQILYFAGVASAGISGVTISGSIRGEAISERPVFRAVPYRAKVGPRPASLVPGGLFSVSVELAILWPVETERSWIRPEQRLLPAFANSIRWRSSNPEVLAVASSSGLVTNLVARGLGTAVVDLAPGTPAEVAAEPVTVAVVAPAFRYETPEVLVPAGTWRRAPFIAPMPVTAQFRVPPGSTFQFAPSNVPVSEMSQLVFLGTGVNVAATGPPGQRGSFIVSAPGIPETSVPLRSIEAVLAPEADEIRIAALPGSQKRRVSFTLRGLDGGRLYVPGGNGLFADPWATSLAGLRLRTRLSAGGICEAPPELVLPPRSAGASLELDCRGRGAFTLWLEPGPGVSPEQSRFSVRVVVVDAAPPARFAGRRVIAAKGLQTMLPLWDGGPFVGTLTSSDPSRVLLSADPLRPGAGQIANATSGFGDVWVQGLAADGIVIVTAIGADGRRSEIPVYLFPATLAVRTGTGSSTWRDPPPYESIEHGVTDRSLQISVFPIAYDPETGRLIGGEQRQIRGGTDPFFVRLESSDPTVARPEPPAVLFSEGVWKADLGVALLGTGSAELRVAPTPEFPSVPDASLRLRVFEREIRFTLATPRLSRDLQRIVSLWAPGGGSDLRTDITVTSLDPEKLLLSANQSTPGAATLTLPRGTAFFYAQAQSAVQPGDRLGVRITAPEFRTTEEQIEIVPAELQLRTDPRILAPQIALQSVTLAYGPVDILDRGQIDRTFNGGWRPGVSQRIRVISSNPAVLEVAQPDLPLAQLVDIAVRTVRPGRAELRIEAAPEITNRAGTIPLEVGRWRFGIEAASAARGLVSRLTLSNPSPSPANVTLSVVGGVPVVLGTAPSGSGAPGGLTLAVPIPARGQQDLFVEAGAGEGFSSTVAARADDFEPAQISVPVNDPDLVFAGSGPLTANLASGAAAIELRLTGSGRELPLGGSRSPLRVEILSSNSSVISGGAVEFLAGESRKPLRLELRGRGDAILTFAPLPGFNNLAGRPLLVSVR